MKLCEIHCDNYIEYFSCSISPFIDHWNACFYGWNCERNIGLDFPYIIEQNHVPFLSFERPMMLSFYINFGVFKNFCKDIP